MPSDETLDSGNRIRRRGQKTRLRAIAGSMPPIFTTRKLRKAIEQFLPARHHQRLHEYFEKHGCLHCSRKDVLYGANGFCMGCISKIGKRIRKIDKELRARKPAKQDDSYLRPYNSARRMLADLLPTIGKGRGRKKPMAKSPPKVYMKF